MNDIFVFCKIYFLWIENFSLIFENLFCWVDYLGSMFFCFVIWGKRCKKFGSQIYLLWCNSGHLLYFTWHYILILLWQAFKNDEELAETCFGLLKGSVCRPVIRFPQEMLSGFSWKSYFVCWYLGKRSQIHFKLKTFYLANLIWVVFSYKFWCKQDKSGRKMQHLRISCSADNFAKESFSDKMLRNLNFAKCKM